MELIKKIKQAETKAQQIIEQARVAAAERTEKGRADRLEALAQDERERKKTIEAAVAAAHSQGLAEVDNLKAQAEKRRQQLHKNAESKMAPAAAKVVDYLRG